MEATQEISKKKPSIFGGRTLNESCDVYDHNAWDNIEFSDEYLSYAEERKTFQKENGLEQEDIDYYNSKPEFFWNKFYRQNQNNFFKDRNWLKLEFPEIFSLPGKKDGFSIFEYGCGAGNTVFPLLKEITDPLMKLYACDYSKTAVDVVQRQHEREFSSDRRLTLFQWDICSPELPAAVQPGSLDLILCIFVMSALHPAQWQQTIDNMRTLLKPTGKVLFRDYGRNDMVQLRFKGKRLLDANFYIRGDGTRVYFFESEQLRGLFARQFSAAELYEDRRLIVNRKRMLQMHRVWIQAKFSPKLSAPGECSQLAGEQECGGPESGSQAAAHGPDQD